MRILLIGTGGQLGRELAAPLASHGAVIGVDRTSLDLQSADAIVSTVRTIRPDLIINAAAYTAVDRAETEVEAAFAVNATAPGILAEEARRIGALLVHYSTDYVFDGQKSVPYLENDRVAPINVYGRSKLAGERAILAADGWALILRTSWVYSWHGRNFFLTMRRLAAEKPVLRVVADQVGVPNWTGTLASATLKLIELGIPALVERRGLYHLSCHGSASWFDFARAIVADTPSTRVVPITTAEYPLPALRPAYGVLSVKQFESTFNVVMPSWQESLTACRAEKPPPASSL